MNLGIVEDTQFHQFLPLVYFRPVFHLRCGLYSLEERLRRVFPKTKVSLHVRPYLAAYLKECDPSTPVNEIPTGDMLFVNGRILADDSLAKLLLSKKTDTLFTTGGVFAGAFVTSATLEHLAPRLRDRLFDTAMFEGFTKVDISGPVLQYPWDLVHNDAEWITADAGELPVQKAYRGAVIHKGAHLLNKNEIRIGSGSVIKPGAVLDAEEGPIVIGNDVTIMPNAVVVGPSYIGNNTVVKIGAKIYHSNIGAWCKAGGEIEGSIMHSHSNKQHEGFLGHAYVGSWTNLGADTNNSDLKNNYSPVKVILNGKTIDTGMLFVGLTMGDHSKTGINTMFDTGTVIGVACNLFDGALPPKSIPSFSWGNAAEITAYDLEKSLLTARAVMSRRKVALTPAYERLYRTVHELAKDEPGSPIIQGTGRTVH